MQKRSFLLLTVATIVTVALAAIVLASRDRGISRAPSSEPALSGLAAKLADLTWLRVSRGSMTVNFTAIGGRWVVVEKGNYPAAANRVSKLLLGLADLKLIEPKTERPELWPRLDLDDPSNGKATLVAVQDRTGAPVAQLVIGRSRPDSLGNGDDGVYVRKPGSERAWLARGSFDLAGDLTSWLDRRILDIRRERIASIVLTAPDGTALLLSRLTPNDKFVVEGLPADAKIKSDEAIAAPAAALENLDLDDVKPAADMPIAGNGATTAAYTTFDGLIIGLSLSPPGDADWLAVDVTGFGPGEADAKSLSGRVSHWSYAIPPANAKLVRATLGDLLQPPNGS